MLAPLEKTPPLPEVPDKMPLDVTPPLPEVPDKMPLDVGAPAALNPTYNNYCRPSVAGFDETLHLKERAGFSKPFPEYYKERILPSCGEAFWSSLHAKFAKVQSETEKEPAASSARVPTLTIPSRPGTAGVSRPGSGAGSRTPKPQVLLSGGKLRVLGETPLESGRFRRPDTAGTIKEENEKCYVKEPEVHQIEFPEDFKQRNCAEEMQVLSPCLKCLTVN